MGINNFGFRQNGLGKLGNGKMGFGNLGSYRDIDLELSILNH